ncbi:MAG: 6-bladed beta-propeller [Gemmatimonadota bacterium]|nr:6-bladed beta-propeller [Gemmatimonadota bacterium]
MMGCSATWKGGRPTLLTGVVAIALTAAACGTDAGTPDGGPNVVTEKIGDTTVVRTLSGSVWHAGAALVREVSIGELEGPEEYLFGSIWSIAVDDDRNVYVFDEQAQHVRVFDSEGVYMETLGGRGEGPGEFSRAEAIALLPDGRLVVRDPGNMRIEVFGPGTGRTEQWRYNSGYAYSMSPLHTDALGRTFLVTRDVSRDGFVMHIIVIGPDGTHVDTLPEPSSPLEPPILTAEFSGEGESGSTSAPVPFSPRFQWTVHPSGHFLTGLPSEYRIDLARDDGVLRIERATDPPPIHDDERSVQRERVVRSMRNTDPNWSWTGPPIPEHKPFYQGLVAGRKGRIWVRLVTESHPVENENHDPENPFSTPVIWREPLRYDVFESDGTYLGVVVPPDGFSPYPNPVFDGDHVWAVTRDDLGVQRVVRYRIAVGDEAP